MTEKLKPCPFCGKPPEVFDLDLADPTACCPTRGCAVANTGIRVSKWNTRPGSLTQEEAFEIAWKWLMLTMSLNSAAKSFARFDLRRAFGLEESK